MLVHGEASKMEFLKQKVMQEFGINCFMPANGEMVTIQTPPIIPADISRLLLKRTLQQCYGMYICHHNTGDVVYYSSKYSTM